MSEDLPREIHAVMIPVGGARILLPNVLIAEIAPLAEIRRIEGAPPWLLGRMPWRNRAIPLISFPRLTGSAEQEEARQPRVAVLKTLKGKDGLPYIGILVQGLPRLATITPDLLVRIDDNERPSAGASAHVLVRSDQAIIPDLDWIETKVALALAA
jgi:chemosensory pili system protein ChpC